MKKTIILLSCVVIISFASCSRLWLFFTGGHLPQQEDQSSITDYAIRTGMRVDNLYVFKDSAALNNFYRTMEKLPDIGFYHRNTFLMNVKTKEDCHKTIEMIIDSLNRQTDYALYSLHRFTDLVSVICHPDGSPVRPEDTARADFNVVLYWATYLGKINKRNTLVWEEKLYEKGKELGINVLKVNCDYQEVWESD